jgi:hypothetical protein
MKYLPRRVCLRFAQLVSLTALAFSVPAFAQFEVSPDHFDSAPAAEKKQAAKSPATKAKTQSALPAKANPGPNQGNAQTSVAIAKAASGNLVPAGNQGQAKPSATAARKTDVVVHRKRPVAEKLAEVSSR